MSQMQIMESGMNGCRKMNRFGFIIIIINFIYSQIYRVTNFFELPNVRGRRGGLMFSALELSLKGIS